MTPREQLRDHASRPTSEEAPSERVVPQIVHVIPYNGIGGVETAAASVTAGRYPGFMFRKAYVASIGPQEHRPYVYEPGIGSENNPLALARTIVHLVRLRPDVLILSLWRSCIVGLVVKSLRPRTKIVLFLHNIRHSNWVDAVLTRAAALTADAIWADSASTASQRLGSAWGSRSRAISFVTARIDKVTTGRPAPRFITWGRLHPRKRIGLALEFFAWIHARHPDARFVIIGPDRGEQPMLEAKVAELRLAHAVQFLGPASLPQIADRAAGAAFFIQTSRSEGMGMAVVEAMQLGLVPVVTPVGEIGTYVTDGRNGVWFTDPAATSDRIDQLLADPAAFRAMREAAVATWRDRPLYGDEFLRACSELVAKLSVHRR